MFPLNEQLVTVGLLPLWLYIPPPNTSAEFPSNVQLLTVGLLFPELRGAKPWRELGRRVLEREIRRQVAADGSYIQQSVNYHRVMLQVSLWVIRLCRLHDWPLSGRSVALVSSAGEFLHHLLDDANGRAPNYGSNDGALVLPLSSCDYTDHRPTVQAAFVLTRGRTVLPKG